ncbi:MAG: hypothetical protein KAU23_02590 [Anaerolineales bacterium]|nr:hypothetical protein [Anaerolineales bacterium]
MVSEPNPSPETNNSPIRPKKSIGGILLRLMITIITAVILGAVIYFSVVGLIPYLDNRVFQPIDDNQAKVQELKETQQALEDQILELSETLEFNQTLLGEGISAYQSTLYDLQEGLKRLNQEVISAQEAFDYRGYTITVYPQMMATLSAKQVANSRYLAALATAQFSSSSINQDLDLLRILELLSRANQFLLHSNFGQAEETLLAAKFELLNLQENLLYFQRDAISSMLNLVDQAIIDLPAKPALAAEKLELAWQLGINGLPRLDEEGYTGTITPTPYIQTSPTFTPTPP